MESKVCGKCKQEKPVSEFYKSKRDGFRSRCKTCCKDDCRDYTKTGYYRQYQREYYKKPEVKARKHNYQNKPDVKKRINMKKIDYRQRPEVKIKNMARWYTNHEIRAGRVNREPCALCGREQGEAHHSDYNQPLLIVWLCADCHRAAHLKFLKEKGIDSELD